MTLTAEQHEIRRTGLGASEMAAVVGLSPYAKPIDVYLQKLGLGEPIEGHHIERGQFLEPALLSWYAHRFKRTLTYPGTLRHPKYERILATPDAIGTDEHGVQRVVEIKAPCRNTEKDWGPPESDAVPDYHRCQVMCQMAVTGLREAEVIGFLDGDIQRYTVPWHEGFFEKLAQAGHAFWDNHIVPRVPPPEDGSKSYSQYVEKMLPDGLEDMVEDDSDTVADLVEGYQSTCEKLRELDTQKKIYRQRIQLLIGDRKGLRGWWGKVHWRNVKDGVRVDWESIARAMDAKDSLIAQHTRTVKGYRAFKPYIDIGK